jgi:hypothetical protein
MMSANTHLTHTARLLGWGIECHIEWIDDCASHALERLLAPAGYVGVSASGLHKKAGCRNGVHRRS